MILVVLPEEGLLVDLEHPVEIWGGGTYRKKSRVLGARPERRW